MRNTIRKVTMVVLVLITSCQVSLKRNRGPVRAQARMIPTAAANATGLPVTRAVRLAKRVNHEFDLRGRMYSSLIAAESLLRGPERGAEEQPQGKGVAGDLPYGPQGQNAAASQAAGL